MLLCNVRSTMSFRDIHTVTDPNTGVRTEYVTCREGCVADQLLEDDDKAYMWSFPARCACSAQLAAIDLLTPAARL